VHSRSAGNTRRRSSFSFSLPFFSPEQRVRTSSCQVPPKASRSLPSLPLFPFFPFFSLFFFFEEGGKSCYSFPFLFPFLPVKRVVPFPFPPVLGLIRLLPLPLPPLFPSRDGTHFSFSPSSRRGKWHSCDLPPLFLPREESISFFPFSPFLWEEGRKRLLFPFGQYSLQIDPACPPLFFLPFFPFFFFPPRRVQSFKSPLFFFSPLVPHFENRAR